MYEHFYGLRERPFELTPNPKYLLLTAQHREALSTLQYGLFSAKAITVLTGEAGTGKTTLLHAALESDACQHVQCVYLSNPTLTRVEFLALLAHRFSLSQAAAGSKDMLLREMEAILLERRAKGQITALVVDEAQGLSDELLEELRLLANIETANDKLLPLVLAGQPELATRLNDLSLRQLKQRIALRCQIVPFDLQNTSAYIASRIQTAGGDPSRLFTREAIEMIHKHARGIPRTVSVICDNALLSGFAVGRRPVGSDLILEVCLDFDLVENRTRPARAAESPAPARPPGPVPDDTDALTGARPRGRSRAMSTLDLMLRHR